MGVDFPMRSSGVEFPGREMVVGLISPLRVVAGTRFESMVPSKVGHRP